MPVKPPSNFEEVISEDDISREVSRLAVAIDSWISSLNSSEDIVVMPVMRGAIFFFADLVREFSHSVEIAPVRCWSYVANQNGTQLPEVKIDLDGFDPTERDVLLVDEICDSGRTFHALKTKVLNSKAKSVKTVALIQRKLPTPEFRPDWTGFEYPNDDWLIGCGMKDNEKFRNLKSIYRKLP